MIANEKKQWTTNFIETFEHEIWRTFLTCVKLKTEEVVLLRKEPKCSTYASAPCQKKLDLRNHEIMAILNTLVSYDTFANKFSFVIVSQPVTWDRVSGKFFWPQKFGHV